MSVNYWLSEYFSNGIVQNEHKISDLVLDFIKDVDHLHKKGEICLLSHKFLIQKEDLLQQCSILKSKKLMCVLKDCINIYLLSDVDQQIFNDTYNSVVNGLDNSTVYHSNKQFDPYIKSILVKYPQLICAGGSVSGTLFDKEYNDYDIWFIGDDESIYKNIITDFMNAFGIINLVDVIETGNATTIILNYTEKKYTIQFINGCNSNMAQVVNAFDLDCCCFIYDGNDYHTVPRGLRVIQTHTNIVFMITSPIVKRMHKYEKKGWNMQIPGFVNFNDFFYDDWVGHYPSKDESISNMKSLFDESNILDPLKNDEMGLSNMYKKQETVCIIKKEKEKIGKNVIHTVFDNININKLEFKLVKKYNSRRIDIRCDGEPYYVQLSNVTIPWGMSKDEHPYGSIKYSIMGYMSENIFENLDDAILKYIHSNSQKWFGRPRSMMVLKEFYYNTSGLTQKSYEPKKYKLKMKFKMENEKLQYKIFDTDKKKIDGDTKEHFNEKNMVVDTILRCNGVWFCGSSMICSWYVEQIQIKENNKSRMKLCDTMKGKMNQDIVDSYLKPYLTY